MKHLKLLPASSLALLLSLIFGSANAQVTIEPDPTFDVVAEDAATAETLRAKEEALSDFFEKPDAQAVEGRVVYTPDSSPREAMQLLERAEQEMGEFNDIDADDLAELDDPRQFGSQPRLEKPGQLEKDAPILDCPAGTVAQFDACVAVVED